MKIVHIYAQNLQVWESLIKDSHCLINAHVEFNDLIETLPQYNTCDVIGVILFPKVLDNTVFKMLSKLNNSFYFIKKPVVVIGDHITKFFENLADSFKNLSVYILNSENNSISDTDVNNIMTLLLAEHGGIYNFPRNKYHTKSINASEVLKDKNSNASFVLKLMLGDDRNAVRSDAKTSAKAKKKYEN